MRIHRVFAALAVVMLTAVLMVTATVAAPANFKQATGSVWLSTPTQYVEFNAFDYGPTGDRGTIYYTNFEATSAGSGAWLPAAGTYALTTALGGAPAYHTMNVDTVTVVTPTNVLFSGTGFYILDPTYTWTVTGSITDGVVTFHLLYTGAAAGYTFDATGLAATMSGTAVDSLARSPLTWTLPATFAHEVLSFTAAVTCAVVDTTNSVASFGAVIPAVAYPGISGLTLIVNVSDGGSPGAGNDTYGHTGILAGTCGLAVPTTNYPIVGGNLVVH